jgi:hypothetical protein
MRTVDLPLRQPQRNSALSLTISFPSIHSSCSKCAQIHVVKFRVFFSKNETKFITITTTMCPSVQLSFLGKTNISTHAFFVQRQWLMNATGKANNVRFGDTNFHVLRISGI